LTTDDKRRKNVKTYARYSGMATEMFGLLIVMFFVGKKIDDYFENDRYIITALLLVAGLFLYLFRLYFQLNKSDKK